MAGVMLIQQQLQQTLTAGTSLSLLAPVLPQPASITPQQQQLKKVLEEALFGSSPEAWLEMEQIDQLLAWSRQHESVATQFIRYLERNQWSQLGRSDSIHLPELESIILEQQLQQSNFVAQPLWNGTACETSPLTRTHTPLLDRLQHHYGSGLLTRSVARLTELAQLVLQLDTPTLSTAVTATQPNTGFGVAQAARGQLLHHVTVDGDHIQRYQILAPTEWNFHPQGAVAQSLSQLDTQSIDVEQQARLIIHAIDPCVGYDLTIHH
jgi:Ni,Fe-hydrogenase I large subunit